METAGNIDHREVEKFNALAARWWDPESEFKPLHAINPLRLKFITDITSLTGKRVLDVGCGGGILAESLATQGAKVTGIDMAPSSLEVARLHLLESGEQVDYRLITVEDLAREQQGHYDVVTCMEMLEHVPDPVSVVAACARLVKPGGEVFLSTLNRNSKSYLLAILGAEYLLQLLPKGTHSYAKFIKPSELDRWCRQAGLLLMKLQGIGYNPLTRSYLTSANVDVNYLAHFHRP